MCCITIGCSVILSYSFQFKTPLSTPVFYAFRGASCGHCLPVRLPSPTFICNVPTKGSERLTLMLYQTHCSGEAASAGACIESHHRRQYSHCATTPYSHCATTPGILFGHKTVYRHTSVPPLVLAPSRKITQRCCFDFFPVLAVILHISCAAGHGLLARLRRGKRHPNRLRCG